MNHAKTHARKPKKMKKLIGILLLVAIAYFIFTNFDFADWPKLGLVIEGQSKSCTEIRGPKTMTDTVIEQLEVEDLGFKALRDENKALIEVRNVDNVTGKVRVVLYCRNGDEQGEKTKSLEPGEKEVFSFLDVKDCDLGYIIEPETRRKRVNKTVYVTDSMCE
jgi:hypothetical protein